MRIFVILSILLMSLSAFAGKVRVEVAGMTCGMCVDSITKELKSTEKVENINVGLEKKEATFIEIKGKKISDAEIKAAIKKAGYEAVKIHRQ